LTGNYGNFIRNKADGDIIHDDLITNKDKVARINYDTTTIEKNITKDVVNKGQLLDKEGEINSKVIDINISSNKINDMKNSEGKNVNDV